MKRRIALICVMCLMLSSCGGGSGLPPEVEESSSEPVSVVEDVPESSSNAAPIDDSVKGSSSDIDSFDQEEVILPPNEFDDSIILFETLWGKTAQEIDFSNVYGIRDKLYDFYYEEGQLLADTLDLESLEQSMGEVLFDFGEDDVYQFIVNDHGLCIETNNQVMLIDENFNIQKSSVLPAMYKNQRSKISPSFTSFNPSLDHVAYLTKASYGRNDNSYVDVFICQLQESALPVLHYTGWTAPPSYVLPFGFIADDALIFCTYSSMGGKHTISKLNIIDKTMEYTSHERIPGTDGLKTDIGLFGEYNYRDVYPHFNFFSDRCLYRNQMRRENGYYEEGYYLLNRESEDMELPLKLYTTASSDAVVGQGGELLIKYESGDQSGFALYRAI